jgi:predicted NBD/HSP70 family sugar kinase
VGGWTGPYETLPTHGAAVLPSVHVDSYNLEVEDEDGFIGDKASKGAFREILDKWRKPLRELGEDPLGDKPTEEISKKKLDALLSEGSPEAAGLVQSAVEEFAQQLAKVIRRFMKTKTWHHTDAIVVGGGFRASRVGELAIGRSGVILKAEGAAIDIELISHDPDEAGLLGAAHLLPAWMLAGFEGLLAVDVGGTNIRAGVVQLNLQKAKDLSESAVMHLEHWRHGDEDAKRDDAVERLVEMLQGLVKEAKKSQVALAPVVGIGPRHHQQRRFHRTGRAEPARQLGEQPLQSSALHLRTDPQDRRPCTVVVMHNDAVVQGLSQLPLMQEHDRWGVLTIGTGLGNARFTNRRTKSKD